jgi:hypothetical protein
MNNTNARNRYDFYENYVVGYTTRKLPFYIDLEDYDKIKDILWHTNIDGYIVSSHGVCLHRIVMNCPKGLYVDHIGGDDTTNDNRKSNLRITTNSQNLMNRRLQKNNTSGVTGVSWNKLGNKWEAYIKINKKIIHLGRYAEKEDAINARKKAERKYFGEYSYEYSQEIYKQANA